MGGWVGGGGLGVRGVLCLMIGWQPILGHSPNPVCMSKVARSGPEAKSLHLTAVEARFFLWSAWCLHCMMVPSPA